MNLIRQRLAESGRRLSAMPTAEYRLWRTRFGCLLRRLGSQIVEAGVTEAETAYYNPWLTFYLTQREIAGHAVAATRVRNLLNRVSTARKRERVLSDAAKANRRLYQRNYQRARREAIRNLKLQMERDNSYV